MTTEIILISIDVFVEQHQIPCDGCGECVEYRRLCRYNKEPVIQAIKDLGMTPQGVNKARFVLKDIHTLDRIKDVDGSSFIEYDKELKFNFEED